MPNYLVVRVNEIPAVGQVMSATISVENIAASGDTVADERLAGQQALQRMRDMSGSGVIGVILASNVTRRTFSAPPPNVTVT